jgi:hypothetical protein
MLEGRKNHGIGIKRRLRFYCRRIRSQGDPPIPCPFKKYMAVTHFYNHCQGWGRIWAVPYYFFKCIIMTNIKMFLEFYVDNYHEESTKKSNPAKIKESVSKGIHVIKGKERKHDYDGELETDPI